jgi:signal transduction histidine kinase
VIIHNLVDNAVKVSEGGRISMGYQRTGDKVVVSLSDTGFGMQPALVKWINQQDLPGRRQAPAGYKEMGIGLLIVKDLAVLLGIRIVAASGRGNTSISLEWTEPSTEKS